MGFVLFVVQKKEIRVTIAYESKCAWADIRDKVGECELAVLDLIEQHGPLCDAQIEHRIGSAQMQPKARRYGLAKAGMIKVAFTGPSPYTDRPVKFWTRLNLQEKEERAANGKINAETIRKFYDPKQKGQQTMFKIAPARGSL